MSDSAAHTPRPTTSRPPLRHTVANVAALAGVAAVLIWSALFVDQLRHRSEAATTSSTAQTGQVAGQDPGQGVQTPAPVTTRTS